MFFLSFCCLAIFFACTPTWSAGHFICIRILYAVHVHVSRIYCFMWVVYKIGSAIKSSCKLSYYRTCTFCRLLIYRRSLLISFFAFGFRIFFFCLFVLSLLLQ